MRIETTQNSQPIHKLISIEFVCHGNILKIPEKASKINGSVADKGVYYTITTPFLKEP